jgi:hypothetical protein
MMKGQDQPESPFYRLARQPGRSQNAEVTRCGGRCRRPRAACIFSRDRPHESRSVSGKGAGLLTLRRSGAKNQVPTTK